MDIIFLIVVLLLFGAGHGLVQLFVRLGGNHMNGHSLNDNPNGERP